jgi:hypothetical protein
MAVVYEHLRNDTNEVFYVGIGIDKGRAFDKHGRNPHWKRIVNKVGYTVNIIHKDIDHKEAKKIEILLIEKYGRKNLGLGNLVNMTDGGEGLLNPSIETRQKISEVHKGKILSEESKKKMSEAKKGKIFSEETRQKISEANKGNTNMLGKIFSEETRQKMSEASKGKIKSEETRQKMSEAKKGNTNMLGKIFSEETRQKMSLVQRNKKDVKGYFFNKANKKYRAEITVRGKRIHLGYFNTPEEALQAYQKARLLYFV